MLQKRLGGSRELGDVSDGGHYFATVLALAVDLYL
jgi:hypothetical protein